MPGLPGWHRGRRPFELVHVGFFCASGFRAVIAARPADPAGDSAGAVLTLEMSATRIRRLLAAGRVPRYLLPEGVFDVPGWLDVYRRSPG